MVVTKIYLPKSKSHSYKVGKAQSKPLTALIEYVIVLLKHSNMWVGLGPLSLTATLLHNNIHISS